MFSGLLNMDKGLLFNLKHLTLYPKTTILQYINGKRRQVLNPISYAVLTIGLYLFLDEILPRGTKPKTATTDFYDMQETAVKVGYFLRSKMKFFWLAFAVYCSVFTKLFFRKYNFFEHLAINSFILGHATLLAILTRLIYDREIIIFNFLVFIYISILVYKVFKNPKDAFGSAVLSILVVFLSFVLFIGLPFFFVNFM